MSHPATMMIGARRAAALGQPLWNPPGGAAPPPEQPGPDAAAREVARVRAEQIGPRMEGVARIIANYAGAAAEANRRYYTDWHYNDLLATYRVRDPRLARYWRQLYAAVWDIGIPASAFPTMIDRYEQVDRVFDRIPWPEVFGDAPPHGDGFARCARGIPFWKGADGVPRSLVNPRLYLDDGGYFPRPDTEIEIDMAVAYAMNFEAILLCVQGEIGERRAKLERKLRAMKRHIVVLKVMAALVVPGVSTLAVVAGELIERYAAKDNPKLARMLEAGLSVALSLLVPGAGVAIAAAQQVTEQVLKAAVALLQAELAKKAAKEGRQAVARFATVEEYLREVAGVGSPDRDASVARWVLWVLNTLSAAVFLDALAGKQGVALDALNHLFKPLQDEAAGREAPAEPGAPPPPPPAAPDGGTPAWARAAVGVGVPAAAAAAAALL